MVSSIIDLIIDSVTSNLVLDLETLVGSTDPTKPFIVRFGKLQDDPSPGISVLVHENDDQDVSSWRHTVVNYTTNGAKTVNLPAYEIGGGELWFYRFVVDARQFMPQNSTRDDARRIANVVLSRIKQSIRLFAVGLGPDDFGEESIECYVIDMTNQEGGGGDQFIWATRVWFQVLVGSSSTF